jgi:serine/threonine protein phosphatase PrpC
VYPYRSSDEEALFMVLDGHGEQGDRISEFVMRQVNDFWTLMRIF